MVKWKRHTEHVFLSSGSWMGLHESLDLLRSLPFFIYKVGRLKHLNFGVFKMLFFKAWEVL